MIVHMDGTGCTFAIVPPAAFFARRWNQIYYIYVCDVIQSCHDGQKPAVTDSESHAAVHVSGRRLVLQTFKFCRVHGEL